VIQSWTSPGKKSGRHTLRQTEAANMPHSRYFVNWRNSLPHPLWKLTGFASVSGTTSGNNGMDMYTQFTPWRCPYNL